MAAAHIPAKQLTYKGTYAELSAKLLERETGWCTDDNILYVKGENGLVPLSKVVVIDDSATPEIVQHYVDGGITPIMKAEGTFLYLQRVGQGTAWFMGAEPGQLIFKKWEDDGNFWVTETVPLSDRAKPHVYIWKGMTAEQIWDIVLEAMGTPDPNSNAPLALLADGGTYAIFPYVITQFNMDPDSGTYTYGFVFSATYNDTIETRICNLELDLYTDEVKDVTWATYTATVSAGSGSITTVTTSTSPADLWQAAVNAYGKDDPAEIHSALQLYAPDSNSSVVLQFTSMFAWANTIYLEFTGMSSLGTAVAKSAVAELFWNNMTADPDSVTWHTYPINFVPPIWKGEPAAAVSDKWRGGSSLLAVLDDEDNAHVYRLTEYTSTSTVVTLRFSATWGGALHVETATLTVDPTTQEGTDISWASPEIIPDLSDAPNDGNAYFRKDGEWAGIGDLDTAGVDDDIASGELPIQVGPAPSNIVTIAGKQYRTVVIGNQEWLAENLDAEIGTLGSDCFMYNDDPEMRAKYGLLYKWGTLCSGSDTPTEALAAILPKGWRLPSGSDFNTLFEFVGGRNVAGTKLKTTSGWPAGTNGTDDFGFSGLPGGRLVGYSYYEEGTVGYLWSSFNASGAYYVYLSPYAEVYSTTATSESNAFSVRLVRDYVPSAPRTVKATVQDIVKAGTDSELSATSKNPVQNKVIYEAIGNVEALLATL